MANVVLPGVVRPAHHGDLDEIARVHLIAFPDFFLTTLGRQFLCVMYKAFLRDASSTFLVYVAASGAIVGFAVGAITSDKGDRRNALKYFPEFLLAVLPALVRHPLSIARKLMNRLLDRSAMPTVPVGSAMLRSIAVLPAARGTSVATDLLTAFELGIKARGALSVYLTTDRIQNDRVQSFYFRNGYAVVEVFFQDGLREMLLMKRSLDE